METNLTILGVVDVAPLDVASAAAAIAARDPAAPFAYVVTINSQILLLCADPSGPMIQAARSAWLRLNDSRVLARLQRWIDGQDLPIAPGSDLCMTLLTEVLAPDDPITVIGGDEALATALRRRFGLTKLQMHTPPMGYEGNEVARQAAIAFVREHPARVVFVATGAPRSERLMADITRVPGTTGIGIGIGSGLLFAAGMTARAPVWMQRAGIEWLHRALTEPRRLIPRYARDVFPLLSLAWAARRRARG